MAEINGYSLIKSWFAFAFENPSKVKPVHGALYSWLVELNNRRGWAKEFSAPAAECMAACGIHSYNTYILALKDLVSFGFVEIRMASRNQYTSNVIALSKFDNAEYKAIDKAFTERDIKHCESTEQSIDSILKLETNKQENEGGRAHEGGACSAPEVFISPNRSKHAPSFGDVCMYFATLNGSGEQAIRFFNNYEAMGWNKSGHPILVWQSLVSNWLTEDAKKQKPDKPAKSPPKQHVYTRQDFSTDAEWEYYQKTGKA